MKIYKSIKGFQDWRKTQPSTTIGFVPTMGALHDGHLSLIKQSKGQCKITVVSIFVNQLQFGPNEDFEKYPRTLDHDLICLNDIKIDVLLLPSSLEIYNKKFNFEVYESQISKKLEGRSRPKFFSGVTTIVSKLFNIVQPTHAYFGMKDIQQLCIIKKMVTDLNYNIQICGGSTVRDQNGLALSSRNKYLSSAEQKQASVLYNTLILGAQLIKEKENYDFIYKAMMKKMNSQPNIKIDYLSIASLNDFKELKDNVQKSNLVISGAIYINKVRLIDNVTIL